MRISVKKMYLCDPGIQPVLSAAPTHIYAYAAFSADMTGTNIPVMGYNYIKNGTQ